MSTPGQNNDYKNSETAGRVQRPQRPRVLLVGREARRGNIVRAYQAADFEVAKAVDAEQARLSAGNAPPQLMVVDAAVLGEQSGPRLPWLEHDVDAFAVILIGPPGLEQAAQAASRGMWGYVIQPYSVEQLLATTEIALVRHLELQRYKDAERQLNTALSQGRETSTAVGVYMERYRLSEREAFERLRSQARSQRRKLAILAKEIISATEVLNRPAAQQRRDTRHGD